MYIFKLKNGEVKSVSPQEMFIKIVQDEITNIFNNTNSKLIKWD